MTFHSYCSDCGHGYHGWSDRNRCPECGGALEDYNPTERKINKENREANAYFFRWLGSQDSTITVLEEILTFIDARSLPQRIQASKN